METGPGAHTQTRICAFRHPWILSQHIKSASVVCAKSKSKSVVTPTSGTETKVQCPRGVDQSPMPTLPTPPNVKPLPKPGSWYFFAGAVLVFLRSVLTTHNAPGPLSER